MALSALQKALPSIPMDSELHKSVLDAVSKIGKHLNEMKDSPQMAMQTLLRMMQAQKQAQPNQALAGLGAGGAGGQPPPAPPMLAAPSAPPPPAG